jgi:hypothetical protein
VLSQKQEVLDHEELRIQRAHLRSCKVFNICISIQCNYCTVMKRP